MNPKVKFDTPYTEPISHDYQSRKCGSKKNLQIHCKARSKPHHVGTLGQRQIQKILGQIKTTH